MRLFYKEARVSELNNDSNFSMSPLFTRCSCRAEKVVTVSLSTKEYGFRDVVCQWIPLSTEETWKFWVSDSVLFYAVVLSEACLIYFKACHRRCGRI